MARSRWHRHHRLPAACSATSRGRFAPPHDARLSNRDRESTAFLDEFQELERERDNIRLVLRMTEDPGWDGETRRIGADFLRDHLRDRLESFTYFLAGPPAVVDVMAELLLGGGVPEDRVVPSRISGD